MRRNSKLDSKMITLKNGSESTIDWGIQGRWEEILPVAGQIVPMDSAINLVSLRLCPLYALNCTKSLSCIGGQTMLLLLRSKLVPS